MATRIVQLKGSNGLAVGSPEYFQKLNERNFAGSLLSDLKKYNYYDMLCLTAKNGIETIEEMYQDLKKNSAVMSYISKDNRNLTIKFILGVCDLCKIVGKETSRTNSCIKVLSLSDWSTARKSKASDREIDDAIKIIKNGGTTKRNSSDRLSIIQKAVEYNESTAVRNDAQRAAYLKEVTKGKSKEFLSDVLVKFKYQNRPNDYKGRCGKVICSKEYLDHMEKRIFGKDIPNYYLQSGGDRAYDVNLKNALHHITDTIAKDLASGVRNETDIDIIHKDNRISVETALNQLKLCGCDTTAAFHSLFEKYPVNDITQDLKELMLRAQYI